MLGCEQSQQDEAQQGERPLQILSLFLCCHSTEDAPVTIEKTLILTYGSGPSSEATSVAGSVAGRAKVAGASHGERVRDDVSDRPS